MYFTAHYFNTIFFIPLLNNVLWFHQYSSKLLSQSKKSNINWSFEIDVIGRDRLTSDKSVYLWNYIWIFMPANVYESVVCIKYILLDYPYSKTCSLILLCLHNSWVYDKLYALYGNWGFSNISGHNHLSTTLKIKNNVIHIAKIWEWRTMHQRLTLKIIFEKTSGISLTNKPWELVWRLWAEHVREVLHTKGRQLREPCSLQRSELCPLWFWRQTQSPPVPSETSAHPYWRHTHK